MRAPRRTRECHAWFPRFLIAQKNGISILGSLFSASLKYFPVTRHCSTLVRSRLALQPRNAPFPIRPPAPFVGLRDPERKRRSAPEAAARPRGSRHKLTPSHAGLLQQPPPFFVRNSAAKILLSVEV